MLDNLGPTRYSINNTFSNYEDSNPRNVGTSYEGPKLPR